jgi:hypothetical protein
MQRCRNLDTSVIALAIASQVGGADLQIAMFKNGAVLSRWGRFFS